jgi:hypothetical protein
VDRHFLKWLENKLGPDDFRKLQSSLPEHDVGSHTVIGSNLQFVMGQFERMKRRFTGTMTEEDRVIELPGELNNLQDMERDILEGEVQVSELVQRPEDLCKT